MKEITFRKLTADEIECRVGIAKQTGCTLLLYKDARCDQNILDEAVGAYNWQRHHSRDNANCIVALWDEEKKQWIEKEDVGTESNTEAEKGIASDSFKRACVNWGIGRELYTAPFIWIDASKYENNQRNGKFYPSAKFKVTKISYDDKGRINGLVIINASLKDSDGKLLPPSQQVVFTHFSPELVQQLKTAKSKKQQIVEALQES